MISPTSNFLALVALEFLFPIEKFLNKQTKKKCQNCHNLNVGADSAFLGASKFETYILLLQFVYKLFKPPIGVSVFGSETRIT